MPTEIHFAAENVRITVEEEPSQVAEAFATVTRQPLQLSATGGRGELYVNPAAVAFWCAARSAAEQEPPPPEPPEPEPPEPPEPPSPQPPTQGRREEVTDIWGQPLRGKRRR